MAIDTRDKRASAVFVAIGACYPTPDGTIVQADRQHATRLYRGISPGAPPAIEPYASYGVAWLYTAANHSGGGHYFEADMRAVSGTVYARLYNKTDGTVVTHSDPAALPLTSTSAQFERKRTASAGLALTDGKEYEAQFSRSTGGDAEARGAFVHYY